MLPYIAVPIIHSSGSWIASTAAGGYVAGTLSSTWVGAFIAGNASWLSGLGLTSAAGVMAAMSGGISSLGAALGSGLTAVGLGGVAQSLGLAPVTYFGLTALGWSIIAVSGVLVALLYRFGKKKLIQINDARMEGGLPEISWLEIIDAVREYEAEAMRQIIKELSRDPTHIVTYDKETDQVCVSGKVYKISDLKYVIEKTGREYIALKCFLRFWRRIVYIVKGGH